MCDKSSFFKAPRYLFRKHNVLDIVKTLPDIKTFLDVGCGAGELACSLAERGKRGVAIDFSKNAIKIANHIRISRGINRSALQFKLGGLENVAEKKFDMVSCFEVLEHVEDDKELLKQLVKHSRKYLLISVPAKQRLFDSSDVAVGHYRRYEKNDLINMLDDADLRVVKFINYGYPFTDIVRVARKIAFNSKLKNSRGSSMKSRTKDSGINPIKLPSSLARIDLENLIKPFYLVSRLFNSFNLSEGYLVLCEKKSK